MTVDNGHRTRFYDKENEDNVNINNIVPYFRMENKDMGRGSTPRLAPWDLFLCGTPTEKASREGQRFCKTEVAESPIPSHTDVVADHAQRTNYILFYVGIGACLNVTA
jgi:hypothetical protein